MATKLKNGWNEGEATEDGVYLRAFDEWDDDEDADEFHLIGGKWHKDGAPWVCYGGVWKRTGDLPNAEKRDTTRLQLWSDGATRNAQLCTSDSRNLPIDSRGIGTR